MLAQQEAGRMEELGRMEAEREPQRSQLELEVVVVGSCVRSEEQEGRRRSWSQRVLVRCRCDRR